MAEQEANGILAALQASFARKQATAQQASLEAFRQQQQKEADARLKIEQQKANDEHDYHQTLMDSAKQLRKLQLQQDLEKAQQNIYNTGTLPPGSKFMGTGSFDKGGTVQLPEINNDENGIPQTLNIDPLQQHAQTQADIQRTLLAPKQEGTRAEKEAEAKEAQAKLLEQRQWMMQQSRLHEDAEDKRAALANSSRERVASMKVTPETPAVDPDTFTNYVGGLLNGDFTVEGLRKQLQGKAGINTVNEATAEASKHGIPLKDKDVQKIYALQKMVNNIPLMDSAIAEKPDTNNPVSGALGGLGLIGNAKFNSAVGQLQQNLGATSVAASMSNRLSTPEMNAVKQGYNITKTSPKNLDIQNRDYQYAAAVKAAEDIIPGASSMQKAAIKKKLGLDKLAPWNVQQINKNVDNKINSVLPPLPPQQQVLPQQ